MKKFINSIKLFIRYILAAWEENRYVRKNKICIGCSHFKSFMGTAGVCEYQNIGHNSSGFKDCFDKCNCNKFTDDYDCSFIGWFKSVEDKIKKLFLKFTPLGYIIFGLIIIFFFLPSFLLSLTIISFWLIITRIIKYIKPLILK